MWRRGRGHSQPGSERPETAGHGGSSRAWRLARRRSPRVALMAAPDSGRGAVSTSVIAPPSAGPTNGRLGPHMLSVYCTVCGAANPPDARFCSQCGAPLMRGTGERPGETTSMISLAGAEISDAEFTEEAGTDAAAADALPAGTALLVVRRGPNAGSRFLLDSDLTLVGRHPESDIFLDDVTVSRRHAEFYRQDGEFLVRDVGSLNGTYVNRERIEELRLSGGDEVQVGKFRLVFLLSPDSAAHHLAGA